MHTATCQICNSPFESNHSCAKYCSEKCRRQGWRAGWRKFDAKNRKKRRAFQREWYIKNKKKRTAQIKKYQQSPAGLKARQISRKRMEEKYPEKIQARQEVLKALRKGLLVKRPCEVTGCKIKKVEAHHDDYSKPLEVRWRCRRHHRELENRLIK
jgi:hypothetical protein